MLKAKIEIHADNEEHLRKMMDAIVDSIRRGENSECLWIWRDCWHKVTIIKSDEEQIK